MRYDEGTIDEVRQANDIVDVISQTVQLTRRGSNYFGLCPFHNEKTPSFSVSPSRQIFYCFGCHEGGNVFSFVEKIDKLSFPEAVRQLADRAHITLPSAGDPEKEKQKTDKRKRLLAGFRGRRSACSDWDLHRCQGTFWSDISGRKGFRMRKLPVPDWPCRRKRAA